MPEKRMVAAFASPPRNQQGTYMFVESGNLNEGSHSAHVGPSWLPNGDFTIPSYAIDKHWLWRFKRVK